MGKTMKLSEVEQLTEEQKEKLQQKRNQLVVNTWLSTRQADIYLLYKETEEFDTLREVAQAIGIEEGTVYKHWRKAKDKVSKSRATMELEIG